MKGYIPIDLPTKPYIKAYIIYLLGEKPIMDLSSTIGNKLYDLLAHSTNERKSSFNNPYSSTIRIYINQNVFRQRGANLNETNLRSFNQFVQHLIKERFHIMMDDFIAILPSFEAHLPEVRKRLGIDIEAWSDDSMKKDYYRYRKNKKKPLLYTKTFTQNVPSVKACSKPF